MSIITMRLFAAITYSPKCQRFIDIFVNITQAFAFVALFYISGFYIKTEASNAGITKFSAF